MRPGVMPPKPGPPPRQTPRRTIVARRLIALGALAVALLVVGLIVLATHDGNHAASPTTTAIVQERQFKIVFPEGFDRADMAHRVSVVAKIAQKESHKHVKLSRTGYLHWSQPRAISGFGSGKRQLEGFLFPALYDFSVHTTSQQLVADQLAAFRQNWRQVNLSYARSKNLTAYDVLIIASMVEKEALVPDERPLVAAVIYNRLHDHMPLGIDATIRYGLHVPGTKSLTQSDLQSDNPYNTRKLLGLPPTPIANPGLASMQAAAHPAHVDYLYYVRKPDKQHHYFTASYQDFVNHEIAYGYAK
ncbi:MAG: endolytic transglycosylase MltG [Actinomycetota bacterium]